MSEILKSVKEEFLGDKNLEVLLVYGSAVTGKMRADSDVDVAVLYRASLNLERRMDLVERLEERVHRNVDLVDLYALNGVILKKILTKGTVLIKNSEVAYEGLLCRMVYNQQDMMPYYHRALKTRLKGFIHG